MMGADPHAGDADKGKPEESAPPEVEAEIVDAEFTVADEGPAAEPSAGPRKAARPTRVLDPKLIAATAVAAIFFIALGVWFAWPRHKPAAASATVAPAETIETAPTVTEPEQAVGAVSDSEPAHPAPPDPSKIANRVAAAKSELGAVDAAPVEGARGLPEPPPPGGANDTLQQAAKDALRELGAAPAQAESPGIELQISPQTVPAEPPIEDGFERLQEEAEARAAEEATGALASADTARAGPAKIGNDVDVAALKDLFAAETSRLSSELSEEKSRSEALERDVAALKQSLNAAIDAGAETRTSEELAALKAEVEKIRMNREEATSGKAAAATFALVGLQQKIVAGAPYEKELKMLEGFAPGAAGLEALAARAATGVPTLGVLKTRFGPAIRQTLIADREARATGLWGRLAARLEGLVSIRPATPQEGSSARAVISRAEARLAADDLGGTVAELRGLEGAAQAAMAPWLDEAAARVAADSALTTLSASLAGRLQN